MLKSIINVLNLREKSDRSYIASRNGRRVLLVFVSAAIAVPHFPVALFIVVSCLLRTSSNQEQEIHNCR
ncbi:MAG: hypothetical protein QNJ54_04155 [Prochloraceae cyanobacterium]|nr:hypothetical protein [Prochloraceae cyanobacterium]